jgi:hypothetical protein
MKDKNESINDLRRFFISHEHTTDHVPKNATECVTFFGDAIKRYENEPVFHAKVDSIVQYIINIVYGDLTNES